MYQDISTIIGQEYVLRFAMSGETGGCAVYGPNGDKTASVSWGGSVLQNITLTPAADNCAAGPWQFSWTYFEYNVTATASSTRLYFADNMPWSTAYGMTLDDVSLVEASVPTPGTLELFGVGLLALFGLRRRLPV